MPVGMLLLFSAFFVCFFFFFHLYRKCTATGLKALLFCRQGISQPPFQGYFFMTLQQSCFFMLTATDFRHLFMEFCSSQCISQSVPFGSSQLQHFFCPYLSLLLAVANVLPLDTGLLSWCR